MWRALARSAEEGDCPVRAILLLLPVLPSSLFLAALLFLGVVPAPILMCLGLCLVCAAVCLRVTRPEQFLDASQASGSLALSLLTGAPRAETDLLLLPPSHPGSLQHLAMLDRGWLSAGGNLLFGPPAKDNRLTGQDLAMLSTHVHEADCKHCTLSSSSWGSSHKAAGAAAIPGAQQVGAMHTAGMSAAAAAVPAAEAGGPAFSSSPLLQPYASRSQRQYWSSTNLQGHSSSSSGSVSSSDIGSSVAANGMGTVPGWRAYAAPHPSGIGHQQQQQHQHVPNSPSLAAVSGTGADTGGFARALPLPQRSAQAAAAAPAAAMSNPTSLSSPAFLGTGSSSSRGWHAGAAAGARWLAPPPGSEAATLSDGFPGFPPVGSSTLQQQTAAAAAGVAAAAAAGAPAGTGQQWPSSAASAALSAHHSSLTQGSFHQGLLKAWGSYASSLDSLDEPSTAVCSICLGSYRPGVVVTQLPCGHSYHKDCIYPWLLQRGRLSTCPMCMGQVWR